MELPHLLGRYALLGELASGGMGTVYLARQHGDLGFGRTVAVKRLRPEIARDPQYQADFLKEGKLAARIRHPNVVGTIDVVAAEGELALVMEYVDGVTLAALLRKVRAADGGVPIPIAAAIVAQILSGLHAAHETCDEEGRLLGIVHRDVSGQNVLVGRDGVVRVADFGVAVAAGDVTRDVKGKLGYMSPEQLSGQPVDRRADVWAAGVLLWEMIARRRLFGGDPGDVIRRVLQHDVPPPSRFAPTLSPDLEDVVLRALGASPRERFRSALEMATALEGAVTRAATTREIAAWLRDVAGDAMSASLQRIRALEHQARALSEPSAAWTRTPTPTVPPRPRRGRAALLVLGALLAANAPFVARVFARPAPHAAPAPAPAPKPAEEIPPVPSIEPVAAAPPPTGTRVAPRPRRPSCSPPWRLDAEGIRIPKPECF